MAKQQTKPTPAPSSPRWERTIQRSAESGRRDYDTVKNAVRAVRAVTPKKPK